MPVAVALPQPDFTALAASLKEVATQIERIPNVPPPGDDIQRLTNLITALTAKIDEIKAAVDGVKGTVDNLGQAQRLLPMQLANCSAGRNAPLRGVQGLLAQPAPRTREELIGFTGNNCIAAAQYLNLPALPQHPIPTVTARRQQIAEHLGITVD